MIGLLLPALSMAVVGATPESAAFYYGRRPDIGLLSLFDWVVVEPRNLSDPSAISAETVFAYVSAGEIDRTQPWAKDVEPGWIIGKNPSWDTDVVDLRNPGWRHFFFERVLRPLHQSGYRGFFLDTLDSYGLARLNSSERALQAAALVDIIREIHRRFPDVKLLLNRGFEILPQVHGFASGVVAEDLFDGWNAAAGRYQQASPEDQAWLLEQLKRVRDEYRLPVIVIDYRPPGERDEARRTAARIAGLGFIPWVTDARLDMMGVGAVEALPRRVLMIHGPEGPEDSPDLAYSDAHRFAAPVLEYLGYAAEYADAREELFDEPTIGRYAGVVAWITDPLETDQAHYRDWLIRRIEEGTKVLVLGSFGVDPDAEILRRLGLEKSDHPLQGEIHIKEASPLLDFEAPPSPKKRGFFGLKSTRPHTALLRLSDDAGVTMDPIMITGWGGLALRPYFMEIGFEGQPRWIVNPFELMKLALHLPEMPAPDATTENGRRLMLIHVDGDGFANRAELPGAPFGGRVLLQEIFKKYPLPHTVSVIEGEIGQAGLHPESSGELEDVARKIFALPNVEIASHSFSHPFLWKRFEKGMEGPDVHLMIPGYHASLAREIAGSVEYIDKNLAPPDKKCRLFLWTGNALPSASAIGMVDALGIGNMNGGETVISREHSALAFVSPMVRPVAAGPAKTRIQVYAPIGNDRAFTNGWTGPYYGYRRVIETLELTGAPRRLKPIDLYYHFLSGTKPAALTALKQVYAWAEKQETLPVFGSEYRAIAEGVWRESIARRPDGGFIILAGKDARTVRVDPSLGWPDLEHSEGIAGFRDTPQGRFVSLTAESPGGRARLRFGERPPRGPYLLDSNARIAAFRFEPNGVSFRLRGRVPVEARFGGDDVSACRMVQDDRTALLTLEDRALRLRFSSSDSHDVRLICR